MGCMGRLRGRVGQEKGWVDQWRAWQVEAIPWEGVTRLLKGQVDQAVGQQNGGVFQGHDSPRFWQQRRMCWWSAEPTRGPRFAKAAQQSGPPRAGGPPLPDAWRWMPSATMRRSCTPAMRQVSLFAQRHVCLLVFQSVVLDCTCWLLPGRQVQPGGPAQPSVHL
jgi:hypothetical protein